MLDHQARRAGRADLPALTARDALEWATLGGARALGLEDKIGSLEPGKQADLVMIDARALNLWPVHDPIATAMQASLANIEAVMVAGRWRKRGGRLLHQGIDALQTALEDSARRIVASTKSSSPTATAPA